MTKARKQTTALPFVPSLITATTPHISAANSTITPTIMLLSLIPKMSKSKETKVARPKEGLSQA